MINIADIGESNLDYKDEVIYAVKEAETYLSRFKWCRKIIDGWVASSFGYILNILYYKILPDKISCSDEFLWIIVGDIPPAYIDIVSAPTAYDALECYIDLMQEWVENVMNGETVEDCYPLNVPPQKEYAQMLDTRIRMLKEDFLPQIA